MEIKRDDDSQSRLRTSQGKFSKDIVMAPVVGIRPGFITLLVTVDFLAISLRASSSDVITLH